MPMRVGEMMVIIRAEDFASRTLRRVGGEFRTLSRSQAMYQRRASQLTNVNEQMRNLQMIQRRNNLLEQQIGIQQRVTAAEEMAARAGSRSFATRQRAFAAQTQLPALRQQLDSATRAWDEQARIVDAMPGKYRRFALDTATLGAATARLTVDQHNLIQEMDHLKRVIPIERMDNFGRGLSGIGRTMQLFGAVSTASLGLAARSAAEFDTSISSAATQARDLNADASQVRTRINQLTNGFRENGVEIKGVIDLMREFPATQEEMSAAAYEVFSSMDLENQGIIDVAKGLGLLEQANKIAVAGNVDLEEATSAMITVLNNFDPQLANTTEQFDTMFDIVRFGRMRLSDFNIMMNKIAPATADAGMALEDVGGAMAYLTTVMPSQRMVATGISRLIEALRHPDIVKGLHAMGIEAKTASGSLKPLDVLLKEISQKFPGLRTGQQSAAEFFRLISMIGRGGGRGQIFTQEGRRALSEIMTHFDEYIDAQTRIEQNQGEFGATLTAQMNSLGVQWGIFVNQIKAAVLVIGQDAVPVFAELGGWIERFTKWFQQLDPELRRQIVRWAVLVSVGTLLGGVLLAVAGSIISLLAYLKILEFQFGRAALMANALKFALRALAAFALIEVLIKVSMGGDPTAMDFLKGALAGGILGARFGPAGAVLGAITVPVVIAFMANEDIGDSIADHIDKKMQGWSKSSNFRKWGEYTAANYRIGVEAGMKGMGREEFDAFQKTAKTLDARERGMTTGPIHKQKKAVDEAAQAVTNYQKAWEKYMAAMQTYNEDLENYEQATERWQDSLVDATRNAKDTVMQNLRSMYDSMLQENQQAFGDLMQGPWLTSETFDLAKEWGIQPRIQDLIRDLHLQNEQFARWRRSLDQLMSKGLPQEFVDEIRKLGPEEGQTLIDSIIGAKPAQVNKLIQEWKQKNNQIKQATKMDFVDEIERFKKAGLDMGEAIINGFQSAEVGAWFDNWVSVTFPGVINSAVNQAVADWKTANPRPIAPTKPKPPVIPTTSTTSSTVDNSKTININPPAHTDSGDTARDHARARKAAFVMQDAILIALHK